MPTYKLFSFEEAGLPSPTAYYANFADNLNVKGYDNLKVIYNTEAKSNVAIVKGKFFRQPKFPRRVKEEAYVGLQLYIQSNNIFFILNIRNDFEHCIDTIINRLIGL